LLSLPPSRHGMVPISTITTRLTRQIYAELLNIIEILPSKTNTDRKALILAFLHHAQQNLFSLMVLTRWSRAAEDVQKCQDIIHYVQMLNANFIESAGKLFAMYSSIPNARVRSADISTAVDVLATGTYLRLPTIIRNQFIPRP